MDNRIRPVELEKAYRLINHGPAVLVSSSHGGTHNVMSASWACALDFSPPKVTVVIDKMTKTRGLVEKSGYFALQVPTVEQVQQVYDVGTQSLTFMPDKLEKSGVELFRIEGHETPLVAGCSAWLICKLVPEPHNQQTYDLFIGEVVGAWADERAFKDGHWAFETADPRWRSLHYIAGGTFYAIGDLVRVASEEE
ncbi:flavin reductase family protein [Pseudomonas capsici]|uniref:Flavin reductase family protein n=1 Tax=Pseudomonas capsici TaxID=2810614 RepID=A0ABT3BQG3_9PSED|nr:MULTISPECIES: flavin reductase family protein [Pseudomonas]MBN6712494.1 flavin reductase family protein [Pseudomonas capsici]MBN6717769.1 flavin reductase family protein [Pseudomonas capsici]MBN6723180.1 flavin reductase family protein [Pseudomonas capsici]MCV4267161.1 flavin reductase family protein [Pseudomonas capsici]MCV4276215.1 flavin reductase family protein [Pseudomonas capsici]